MFNYQELKKVATKYYPRERGYCAVIAVSVAAQVPFGKSRSLLHKYGRKQGRGAQTLWINQTLNSLGFSAEPAVDLGVAGKWPKTLATATRVLPRRGTFLLYTRGHVSCVRDGVLEDWAAENGSRKRVHAVFEVTEN